MDRAYVTCHMAISLDGKIDGDFHESPQSEEAGKYYYDVIFDLGSSMAGGRVTTQMYSTLHFPRQNFSLAVPYT